MTRPHALVALLVLSILAVAAAQASAVVPGRNGAIAFVRGGDIWTVHADGTEPTQITRTDEIEAEPAWSPDGEWLAFSVDEPDGVRPESGFPVWRQSVWVMRADGTERRQVVYDLDNYGSPAWSPDGKTLLVTRYQVLGPEMFEGWLETVALDGSGRAIIRVARGISRGDWSPDGERIAFVEWTHPFYREGVAWIRPDGTGYTRYPGTVSSEEADDRDAAWSPDGGRLAVTRRRRLANEAGGWTHVTDVVIGDEDGGIRDVGTSDANDRSPAWSPDGRRVAFVTDRDGRDEIYVADADGRNQRRLTTLGGESPAWQTLPARTARRREGHRRPDVRSHPGAHPGARSGGDRPGTRRAHRAQARAPRASGRPGRRDRLETRVPASVRRSRHAARVPRRGVGVTVHRSSSCRSRDAGMRVPVARASRRSACAGIRRRVDGSSERRRGAGRTERQA